MSYIYDRVAVFCIIERESGKLFNKVISLLLLKPK